MAVEKVLQTESLRVFPFSSIEDETVEKTKKAAAILENIIPAARQQSPMSLFSNETDPIQPLENREIIRLPPSYLLEACKIALREEEGAGNEALRLDSLSVNRNKKADENHEALKQFLRECVEVHGKTDQWKFLSQLAQYISVAGTFAGAATLGPGAAGSLLIASGAIGLTNQAIKDTIGWQEVAKFFYESREDQEALVQKISWGLFLVEMGTKLAAGYVAAVPELATNLQTALSSASQGSSLMNMVSTFSTTYFEQKTGSIKEQMKYLSLDNEKIQLENSADTNEISQFFQSISMTIQVVKKAIEESQTEGL